MAKRSSKVNYSTRSRRPVSRVKPNVSARNIENLNAQMEGALFADLVGGIKKFKNTVTKKQLDQAFNSGDYSKLKETIPWGDMRKHMKGAEDTIASVVTGTQKHTLLGVKAAEREEYRQDANNPRLKQYFKDRQKLLRHNITDGARAELQETIRNATRNGRNSAMVAEEIHNSIGVNRRQAKALKAAQRKLEADGTSKTDIKRIMAEKTEAFITARAKVIAITETRIASATAQLESWRAMQEDDVIPGNARKVWVLGWEHPCAELCEPMDGKAVEINKTWTLPNGKKVMTPNESHPQCRCYQSLQTDDD